MYKKLLAIVNLEAERQLSLERAHDLAKRTGADLHVACIIYDPAGTDDAPVACGACVVHRKGS